MESKFSVFIVAALLSLSNPTFAGAATDSTNDKTSSIRTAKNAVETSDRLLTSRGGRLRPTSRILAPSELDEQKSWSRLWD